MQKSSQIVLVYAAGLVAAIAASCFLTYQVWAWEAPIDTLSNELRMVGLIAFPLLGLSLASGIATDRLMWRVVRALRRAECHPNAKVPSATDRSRLAGGAYLWSDGFVPMTRQTIFSPCRTYRYALWREWIGGEGMERTWGATKRCASCYQRCTAWR